MTNMSEILSGADLDLTALSAHLNRLGHAQRLAECRSVGRAAQRRLYDAAEGFMPIGLDFVVPAEESGEVVHHGKNSLPAFTHFAKVFIRPQGEDAPSDELWGYNRGSGFVESVVGPGYFITHLHEVEGEVLVNYLRVPPRKPVDAWPDILPNSARLSRFVYNGTQDILRGVSEHVSIGRATKGGSDMDAWFLLCREPTS
jgi:hypothetical protein